MPLLKSIAYKEFKNCTDSIRIDNNFHLKDY